MSICQDVPLRAKDTEERMPMLPEVPCISTHVAQQGASLAQPGVPDVPESASHQQA